MTWLRRHAALLVACGLGAALGMSVGLGLYAWDRSGMPVSVVDLREDDGVVIQGGLINLLATVHRDRNCPSVTQRYLWRWADLAHTRRHLVPLDGTLLPFFGEGPIMLSLPLPPGLPPGEWLYTAVTADNCSWLPTPLQGRISRTVDVPLVVEPHS